MRRGGGNRVRGGGGNEEMRKEMRRWGGNKEMRRKWGATRRRNWGDGEEMRRWGWGGGNEERRRKWGTRRRRKSGGAKRRRKRLLLVSYPSFTHSGQMICTFVHQGLISLKHIVGNYVFLCFIKWWKTYIQVNIQSVWHWYAQLRTDYWITIQKNALQCSSQINSFY